MNRTTELVTNGSLPSSQIPMCQTEGCENQSRFHGLGKDLCWACYPHFILQFRQPDTIPVDESPQMLLPL